MTTLTASTPVSRSLVAPPTCIERALLQLARALESAAVQGMKRRAVSGDPAGSAAVARADHAERRRDAAALVHVGLLPR